MGKYKKCNDRRFEIATSGFTLVELLAVIAILSILLFVGVPALINNINKNKQIASNKMHDLIKAAAKNYEIDYGISEKTTIPISELCDRYIVCPIIDPMTNEEITGYISVGEDYEFYEDAVRLDVNLNGGYTSQIFQEYYQTNTSLDILTPTKPNWSFIEWIVSGTGASMNGTSLTIGTGNVTLTAKYKTNLRDYITRLYDDTSTRSSNSLEASDPDSNIRYTGSSPNNYIKFNDENWRIIGIFNVKTAKGTTEKLMKIVRNDSIGNYSWDSSESSVNQGYGVNQWGEVKDSNGNILYTGADLMVELNTLYLNSGSGTCYNGSNNASTTCNFTNKGIKESYRSMIENVVWNTAGVAWNASGITGESAVTAYNVERGTTTGQICKGTTYNDGAWCTDTVKRTTTWTGKVGLIYPSDYGFASTNEDCRNWINAMDEDKRYCKNDNWLQTTTYSYWTLSPYANSGLSSNAWHVYSEGCASNIGASAGFGVRPSVYLKSDVSITSGDGSSSLPYIISMN